MHTLASRLDCQHQTQGKAQPMRACIATTKLCRVSQGRAFACAGAGKPPETDIRADGGPTASISGKREAPAGTGAKGAAGKAGGGAKAPEATARLVEVRAQ